MFKMDFWKISIITRNSFVSLVNIHYFINYYNFQSSRWIATKRGPKTSITFANIKQNLLEKKEYMKIIST